MKTEEITQIIETIKTLNLNVDSESAIQIVEMLKPVMYMYLGIEVLKEVCLVVIIISLFWVGHKIIKEMIDADKEVRRGE